MLFSRLPVFSVFSVFPVFLLISLLALSGHAAASDYKGPLELDGFGTQMEAARNQDGRVMVFVLQPNRELAVIRQSAPNSAEWSKPKSLDTYANRIAVTTHADGRIALFDIGTLGNVLYHMSQVEPNSDKWTKETEFKGAYATQLEVAHEADGRIILFFLKPDRELAYIRETAPNSNEWTAAKATGIYANQISVGRHADGRLEIAEIGTLGNVVYRVTQSAPNSDKWGEEVEVKGVYAVQVELVSNADGALSLFMVKPDKEIAYARQTQPNGAEWTKPKGTDLYGTWIALGKRADGRLEMFIIATLGNALTYMTQQAPGSNEWSKETDLGGYAVQMTVATHADGRLELFTVNPLAKMLNHYSQVVGN